MRKDIDLLANEWILLKKERKEVVVEAILQSEDEIMKLRPYHLIPERFIICRMNEAGDSIKYLARAIYFTGFLLKCKETLIPEGEEMAIKAAASLARQLQELIKIRISTLPLKLEQTGSVDRYATLGEAMPVRLLNSMIVLESILLVQLHVLVRGRFTEPDELCAYCFALYSERELRDALRMPLSVRLHAEAYYEMVEVIRELFEEKPKLLKRAVNALEDVNTPRRRDDVVPMLLAVVLLLLMAGLVYYRYQSLNNKQF